MLNLVQVLAMFLVGVAMAPALAHACEFPGKKRLNREAYLAVQTIYYPGFTLLGISEPAGLVAVIVLLFSQPRETGSFWLTLVALVGLLGMQLVYWTLTHPTNRVWLQKAGAHPGNLGGGFFDLNPVGRSAAGIDGEEAGWRRLRNRWEYSHVARAALACLSFISLVLAIVLES